MFLCLITSLFKNTPVEHPKSIIFELSCKKNHLILEKYHVFHYKRHRFSYMIIKFLNKSPLNDHEAFLELILSPVFIIIKNYFKMIRTSRSKFFTIQKSFGVENAELGAC